MTVQQVIRSIQTQTIAWYDQISGRADARRMRIIQYAIGAILGCCVLITLWGAYQYYVSNREQSSQRALSFCFDEYFKVQRGQYASWQELAERFQRTADTNRSSYLYPYFKMLQADALAHVNDLDGALQAMDIVSRTMRTSDPLYSLCALKYRLMQLDSTDESIRAQGISGLELLAHDKKNICADAAQFYLGQYYMAQNQPEKAHQEWKVLLAERRAEPSMSSPWAELISGRISQ